MLRKTAAAMLKRIYRLTQSASRHAVDSHVERYIVDDFIERDHGAAYGITRAARSALVAGSGAARLCFSSRSRALASSLLAQRRRATLSSQARSVRRRSD